MARQCMRPGCDRLAAARLTYDTAAGAVWLDPPLDDGQPTQQVCGVHAATLTAPLGWTMTDRRLIDAGDSRASLTPPIAQGEVSPFAQARRAARAEGPGGFIQQILAPQDEEAEQLEPGASEPGAPEIEVSEPDGSEPEEPHSGKPAATELPKKPEAKPRGKLLDRAFEWTGPQHSVLTTGHGNSRRRSAEE